MEDSLATRPQRRSRRPRRPERQQILLRRALALGAALVLLILIVLGVKGCLNARKHRALSDYAGNVSQIVAVTQQRSNLLFGKLSEPGTLSVTEFVAEVNADRSAMDSYRARIESLDTPGDMSNAQTSLKLVYELRDSAMAEIAGQMSTALGDVGSAKAAEKISKQMQTLMASDILYAATVRPEINRVLEDNGIQGDDVPKSVFLPDGTKWLNGGGGQRRPRLGERLDRIGYTRDPRPWSVRRKCQWHGTGTGIDHRGEQRRNAGSRSPGSEPGRIDGERDHRFGDGQRR